MTIDASTNLERELIGAVLNMPETVVDAQGVLPDHFTDPDYRFVWDRILTSEGSFTFATIITDVSEFEQVKAKAVEAFTNTEGYVTLAGTAAAKLLDLHRRRQALEIVGWLDNELRRGGPVDRAVDGYKARLEGLAQAGTARSRFTTVASHEITLSTSPYLIKRIMPVAGIGFLAGAPKAGKSFLALDIAMKLADGREKILEHRARQCGVAYVAAEDYKGCEARVRAWRTAAQKAPTDILPIELVGGPVNLIDPDCLSDLIRTIQSLSDKFTQQGARLGLVVVDTLAQCLVGVDENSSIEMSRAIAALKALHEATGAFVMAVAHYGKNGPASGMRGWSGLDGASDMTLSLVRSDEGDRSIRTLTLDKVKNGQDGKTFTFSLRRVGLGIYDDDGDELDSCVVQFEDEGVSGRPQQTVRKLPPAAEIVLAAIRYETDNGVEAPIPLHAFKRPWSKGVELQRVRTHAETNGLAVNEDKPEEARKLFGKQIELLVANRRISVDKKNGVAWLMS